MGAPMTTVLVATPVLGEPVDAWAECWTVAVPFAASKAAEAPPSVIVPGCCAIITMPGIPCIGACIMTGICPGIPCIGIC
mmetsp:Transcript_13761/g.36449  ORF Transcript_13761/g.36449 Transcript_13761/m.36449 type:complete len:80 (-) Transcript_13761:476-715(-)